MGFENHKRKALFKAAIKQLPLIKNIRSLKTRGSNQSRYCYAVWLRHLVNLNTESPYFPATVAELGPGDSIGVGLAALLTGSDLIYALDVKNTIDIPQNLAILDDLVSLLKSRSSIPDNLEYPRLNPGITDSSFPDHILNEVDLQTRLDEKRINAIRNEIRQLRGNCFNGEFIKYRAPWFDIQTIEKGSIDLVISQAVMEHVLNLENTYKAMNYWLRTGGKISHQIDFRCHGTSTKWNGHWLYGDAEWKFVNDVEGPAINRGTFKNHINFAIKSGFTITKKILYKEESGFDFNYLLRKMPASGMTEEEFLTSGMYLAATKY